MTHLRESDVDKVKDDKEEVFSRPIEISEYLHHHPFKFHLLFTINDCDQLQLPSPAHLYLGSVVGVRESATTK